MAVLALLYAGGGCVPGTPITDSGFPGNIFIITVDCRKDLSVKNAVVQYLRMARVSDWVYRDHDDTQDIEARYKSLTEQQAADIVQGLKQTAGVLNVDIRKTAEPIRNDN